MPSSSRGFVVTVDADMNLLDTSSAGVNDNDNSVLEQNDATPQEANADAENHERDDGHEDIESVRDLLNGSPELRALLRLFANFLPFPIIILLKFVFEEFASLIWLASGYLCFLRVDHNFVQCASHGSSIHSLRRVLIIVTLVGGYLTAFWFYHTDLFYQALFLSISFERASLVKTLWNVMLKDVCAKHLTVLLKLITNFIPLYWIGRKRRGRLLQTIECLSIAYRCVLPLPPWICYLVELRRSWALLWLVESVILFFCYAGYKAFEFYRKLKPLARSLHSLFCMWSYAIVPSAADLDCVSSCAICFDSLTRPVKLSCNHIFCENCVDTWLEKKRTCPLCRAIVLNDDVEWQSGLTSKALKLY